MTTEEVPGDDIPDMPLNWMEEKKSDIPEDELEGLDVDE